MCCHLTFQTLLQPVRMAHPSNLSHQSRVGSAIFRMQVVKGSAYCTVCTVNCTVFNVINVQAFTVQCIQL